MADGALLADDPVQGFQLGGGGEFELGRIANATQVGDFEFDRFGHGSTFHFLFVVSA